MNFSAVILAGGQSRRMGRDKAWLPVNGQPLLLRQIDVARQLAPAEVFISGRVDTDYTRLGCPVLHDNFADAGPLAGIERALKAASSPLLLVLAVDMPNMSAAFLRRLAANCTDATGSIPRLNGFIEPLAAFYPKSAQALAEAQLRGSQRAAAFFAERCVQSGLAKFYDLSAGDAGNFANWNTPMDS
jgi:molybdenum cofactor guanylyltransferase